MIDYLFRFIPARVYIKELIEEGFVGELRQVHAHLFGGDRLEGTRPFTWHAERDKGGGQVGAFGCHFMDAFRHWFGDFVGIGGLVEVVVKERPLPGSTERRRVETDDAFHFSVAFARGGTGTMVANLAVHFGEGMRFELYGSQGTLVLGTDRRLRGARAGEPSLREIAVPARLTPSFLPEGRDYRFAGFVRLVDDFVRGMRRGGSPSPNFADGLVIQEAMDALYRSAEQGRWVSLPLED